MRLFVAVTLDESVIEAAEGAARELRLRLGAHLDARWTVATKMHITVRFIGNVAEERVPLLLETLRPSLAVPPFDLQLGECGVFPASGPPRVLWVGLSSGRRSLQGMHEEFNRRLMPLGYEPEARPFSGHLTLARIKDAPRRSGAVARDAVRAVQPRHVRCRVSAAIVFESLLSPRGATYRALLDVPCSG